MRLEDDDLRRVDALVRLGMFRSRSEALRELIRLGVQNLSDIASIAAASEKLFELERAEGDVPIRIPGAVKQLLEERGRFP